MSPIFLDSQITVNSYLSMADPYLSSYYPPSITFPYSLNEALWSTEGTLQSHTSPSMDSVMETIILFIMLFWGSMGAWETSISTGLIFPQKTLLFQPGGQWVLGAAGSEFTYGSSYTYPPSSLGGTIVEGQMGFHSDTRNRLLE